jgi:hypothetical protein
MHIKKGFYMLLEAQVLKAVIGHIASGPDGHGVHHEVQGNTNIDANSTGVEVQVNQQSLAAAKANHESGPTNKVIAAALKPQEQYKSVLKKAGVDQVLSRTLGRGIAARHQLRQASAQKLAAGSPQNTHDPRQRHQVRATVDQIKGFVAASKQLSLVPPKKTIGINPQSVMQAVAKHAAPVSQVRKAFSKWGHALQGGSYVEGPKMGHQA